MGAFKAGSKYIARLINDSIANHQMKNAHKTAYQKTGDDMKKARKQDKYIDGKRVYRANLEETKRKIEQKRKNREKLIDDL